MTTEEQVCNCQEKELQQLKNELHKCKTGSEAKNRRIKELDKKVFILMAICVGIGAILGKEALDAIPLVAIASTIAAMSNCRVIVVNI